MSLETISCSSRESSELNISNHLSENTSTSSVISININTITTKIESLSNVLSKVLDNEIEVNSQQYSKPFMAAYKSHFESFKSLCVRLLCKKYLCDVLETIRNDSSVILKLRAEHVKLHLNLYLLIQGFLHENRLDNFKLNDLISYSFFKNDFELKLINEPLRCRNFMYDSLNEFFQPFLIEFIQIQEDQFIKYINKIYDSDKIRTLAKDIAAVLHQNDEYIKSSYSLSLQQQNSVKVKDPNSRSLNDIENYYSPSVCKCL